MDSVKYYYGSLMFSDHDVYEWKSLFRKQLAETAFVEFNLKRGAPEATLPEALRPAREPEPVGQRLINKESRFRFKLTPQVEAYILSQTLQYWKEQAWQDLALLNEADEELLASDSEQNLYIFLFSEEEYQKIRERGTALHRWSPGKKLPKPMNSGPEPFWITALTIFSEIFFLKD